MDEHRIIGVLCPMKMEDLLAQKRISFPSIAEEDILDRSKVDGISKALVIAQTTWFICQCLSRRFLGLDVTEIELVTLAYAVLNGAMYFLWWNKPMNVRCPVPVYLIPQPTLGPAQLVSPPQVHDAVSNSLLVQTTHGEVNGYNTAWVPNPFFHQLS